MGGEKNIEKKEKSENTSQQEQSQEKVSSEVNGDKNFNANLSEARERMAQNADTKRVMDDFPKFDSDGDGFLTKQELNTAIENEQDEQTRNGLTLLSKNYDSVIGGSDDEWFFENDGVTVKDIEKDQSSRQDLIDKDLEKELENRPIFDMDADKNGQLTREELSDAYSKSSGDDKLMLDYMLRKYDDIKGSTSLIVYDDEGITPQDWSIYNHPYAASDPFGPS